MYRIKIDFSRFHQNNMLFSFCYRREKQLILFVKYIRLLREKNSIRKIESCAISGE